MTGQMEKPMKIGTEITVRISLTFQEAPDVHTLLAMTPVRERGKLVRLALERYIAATGHPAGDVEHQVHAISTWLRSRTREEATAGLGNQFEVDRTLAAENTLPFHGVTAALPARSEPAPVATIGRGESAPHDVDTSPSSIKRWLQA